MQGSLHASIVQLVYVHMHRCDVIIDKVVRKKQLVYTATTVCMTNNEGPKEQNSVNHCQC